MLFGKLPPSLNSLLHVVVDGHTVVILGSGSQWHREQRCLMVKPHPLHTRGSWSGQAREGDPGYCTSW